MSQGGGSGKESRRSEQEAGRQAVLAGNCQRHGHQPGNDQPASLPLVVLNHLRVDQLGLVGAFVIGDLPYEILKPLRELVFDCRRVFRPVPEIIRELVLQ